MFKTSLDADVSAEKINVALKSLAFKKGYPFSVLRLAFV
jgi:hypothetical protein